MTLEKFNEQKAKFHEQEKAVIAVQAELDKAKAILEALENERAEFLQNQKAKLTDVSTLSADEYVELKNKDSGLKARIEYYQALIVDLENKRYDTQETLFQTQTELKRERTSIFIKSAEKQFTDLIEETRGKWQEIFTLLRYSGHFKQNPALSTKTEEQAILEYLSEKVLDAIPTDGTIAEEWKIHSEQLNEFMPKTPAKKHAENHQEQPKGLADLINEL
ncbi:hypothetical protein EDC51_1115 [Bibersteinia trehalosi]|uniref:hypothetical protein n=1 Tax=Bibersteinia trehalosi TaxID=47735 RepID=UPI001051C934|nr:hypothetical protein [Bibersteinia trehalosi]TCT13719.1 hypothetical protein EDC51_1115 [Bibersteinia trehalosi]